MSTNDLPIHAVLLVLSAAACTTEVAPAEHSLGLNEDVATVDVPRLPPPPSEQTLCEIVYGRSSQQDIEQSLGTTKNTRTSSTSAWLTYDYADGSSLTFFVDKGVFSQAMVYGGQYPQCWTDEERQEDADAQRMWAAPPAAAT